MFDNLHRPPVAEHLVGLSVGASQLVSVGDSLQACALYVEGVLCCVHISVFFDWLVTIVCKERKLLRVSFLEFLDPSHSSVVILFVDLYPDEV